MSYSEYIKHITIFFTVKHSPRDGTKNEYEITHEIKKKKKKDKNQNEIDSYNNIMLLLVFTMGL